MMKTALFPSLIGCLTLASCVQAPAEPLSQGQASTSNLADPAKQFVLLDGAADGWRASLVHDNQPHGVWRMEAVQLMPQYATPEVVGLDDQGSCWVMVSYSGKWTPTRLLHDHQWLGAVAHGDVDASVPGNELYVGGKKGVIYQIRSYRDGGVDARRIAALPGKEIHTLLAGNMDPQHDGAELIVFTRPGAMYRLSRQTSTEEWTVEHLGELPGRIRDARVLADGMTIVTASRTGQISLLRFGDDGAQWQTIFEQPVGFGRLAIGPSPTAGSSIHSATETSPDVLHTGLMMPVIYSTADNGRVFRHQPKLHGEWETTTIYSGPLGPRGLVAGHFNADPSKETVAVFGYSGRVELLTRDGQEWTAQTLFTDRDRGHWLSVLEIDGRNNTDEIMLSGYGARMVLLAMDPGTGVDELAVPSTKLDRHAQSKP
jgi:hypothetical protein